MMSGLPVFSGRRGRFLSVKIARGSVCSGLRGGYGIRVSGGQEHFLRAGFGCGPWVRLDERRRPAFPRLLARLAWFLDRGVDELLDGALAESRRARASASRMSGQPLALD